MIWRVILCVIVLAALASASARAQAVYKCRLDDGSLSYQDSPCTEGQTLPPPVLDPIPPAPLPAAQAQDLAAAPAPTASAPTPAPAATPLPTLYRCTPLDGTPYVTPNSKPRGRYVPYWSVAPTGINSGIAGRVPIGAPRPKQPIDRPLSPAASAYVYVEDRCHPMARAELCAYWRQRGDEVRRERQAAFFEQREALEQEQAGLRDYLATHCGR
jgi:hypothetical protein